MDNQNKLKLENQVCFSLYALSREVIKLYKPLLDKHNLTYTQYIAMLVMWEEDTILFKQLGKRLHLDSGTLTPVVKKLESMGLVNKYRNKDDDRVVTVELTEKGRVLKEDVLEVPDLMYCNFKDNNKEDIIMLKEYLDKILKSL
ncbi:MAG: MarR family transcriptional regulator [Terrisporobacter sp.]|uniref:MarR family winged helix-turn-helix transcriptional regulator n=1 Tax=Terrisporobacter sp. TaxID=1965305 RepID=UPI002FC8C70E